MSFDFTDSKCFLINGLACIDIGAQRLSLGAHDQAIDHVGLGGYDLARVVIEQQAIEPQYRIRAFDQRDQAPEAPSRARTVDL